MSIVILVTVPIAGISTKNQTTLKEIQQYRKSQPSKTCLFIYRYIDKSAPDDNQLKQHNTFTLYSIVKSIRAG